jgi:putative serine protease PepD
VTTPSVLPNHPTPADEERSTIATGGIAFASAVLGAAAVVAILALFGLFTEGPTDPIAFRSDTTVVQQAPVQIITGEIAASFTEAVAVKVLPSVVTVEVGDLTDGTLTLTGSGSGVILDHGYVVTNHHVIADATVSRIVLQDGRTYDARIVGSDAYTDLAVLAIDVDGLVPIQFGSTENLAIGQPAIAIGNPLGQEGGASLTEGVISALSRTVQFGNESSLYGMLQTDAPITSGSSGGALVDTSGRLIGITSAIGVGRGGAEGIGYAIPIELVHRVTSEIIETGTVRHTFIGIYGRDYVETADDGALTPAGAEIAELWEDDSPAGDAGFKPGDVIVDVEGAPVRTMEDLVITLRLYRVGDEVEITVMRNGKPVTGTVTLVERPPDPKPIVDEGSSGDG